MASLYAAFLPRRNSVRNRFQFNEASESSVSARKKRAASITKP
jgi:hypothetical protein